MPSLSKTSPGPLEPPDQVNPYTDLLAGIDPDAFNLDDMIFSPPDPSAVPPQPASLSALLTTATNDDDDDRLPSSQPNERASNWLMSPPALAPPRSLPPPHLASANQADAAAAAAADALDPNSVAALSNETAIGRGSAPARSATGGPCNPATDDAAAADEASAKRRKVSHESWTADSSPDPSAGTVGTGQPQKDSDGDWGFVQPDLPFGSTQTPSEITFLTARGTSFAPPSRAALERAAKLLGSVLSDDEEELEGSVKLPGGKVKEKARVPFGLIEGENGEGPAPDASSIRRMSTEAAAAPRPPPSATLLPDRRRIGAASIPSGPIPLPPPLSQTGTKDQHTLNLALPPPTALAAPRPRPALPNHLASTPSRRSSHTSFASPGPSSSVRQGTSLAGGSHAGASTPLRRIGISLGTTPRATTPGPVGGTPSGAGRRTRKAFATPFKKDVAPTPPPHADESVLALPRQSAALPGSATGPPNQPNAAAGPSTSVATPGGRLVSVAGTPLRAGITGDRRQTVTPSRPARRPSGTPRLLKSDYPAVFDLTPFADRLSMCEAYIRPEFHAEEELPLYGLPDEIAVINLTNAPFYFFTISESDNAVGMTEDGRVSWEAAHATLVSRGCTRLSTAAPSSSNGSGKQADSGLAWVQNHWSLVLWKLACLCRAKPEYFFKLPSLMDKRADSEEGADDTGSLRRRESESDDDAGRDRWRKGFQSGIEGESSCGKFGWAEMIRQLLYRYEREFNQGHRSCLRRIHEQDSSPGAPMILCVASVPAVPVLTDASKTTPAPTPSATAAKAKSGSTAAPCMIELTDGWYRIAAEVDEVLSQAIKRGKLRIGVKIGISGARLESRTSGSPPLKGFDNNLSHLVLTANTTSLVRWDATLGFLPPTARLPVACLSSLSPEGGLVPLMDIVVERCFPVGWVDLKPDGEPPGEPRGDKEERIACGQWEMKYEEEAQAVQDEVSKRLDVLLTLTERVERLVGSTRPTEAGGSAESEEQYDQLADADDKAAFLRTLDRRETANLASFMRAKYADDLGRIQQEITDELETRCPARQVRSFKIVKFKDAQTTRPAARIGQLCLWDVVQLGEDALEEGKRYLITNLSPGQKRSWAAASAAGEIYLNSRRDTKWCAWSS